MRRACGAAMIWAVVCSVAATAVGDTAADELKQGFPVDVVAHLARAKEIYVATQRKDGSRSSPTPVWFEFIDGAIWFATGTDSHKARRVKSGSPMFVSVNGKDGPFYAAKAEVVDDGAMADRLGAQYAKKYWIAWLGLFRPSRSKLESGSIILLRLTPAP